MCRPANYISRHMLLAVFIALQARFGSAQNNGNVVGSFRDLSQPARILDRTVPPMTVEPTKQPGVSIVGARLTIVAENTLLSKVLRQVAESSGMMIAGTIPDEPVFGTYGPDDISIVLSSLLQGTDTNMVFSGACCRSSRLILIPRKLPHTLASRKTIFYGGPVTVRPEIRTGSPTHPPAELPERTKDNKQESTGSSAMPGTVPGPASVPGGPIWTNERSPNGIKTPCEIRNELIKLGQPLEGVLFSPQGSLDPCR